MMKQSVGWSLTPVLTTFLSQAAAIAAQLQSGGAANRKASDSGGASSAGRDAPASASGAQAQAQFDLDTVGVSLSQFGRSLFVGTKELIEQVRVCRGFFLLYGREGWQLVGNCGVMCFK